MMHFAFDILRATEAAAVAASDFIGVGDKIQADHAATCAMRRVLNGISDFGARIVIGEGKKDDAPGLFEGEVVGQGDPHWDIAVDPLDGTSQTAKGGPGAMAVIAVGAYDHLFATDCFYMKKVAYGPRIVEAVRAIRQQRSLLMNLLMDDLEEFLYYINASPTLLCHGRLTVCMLDRPRHEDAIKTFRKCGWRVRLIQDCDVSAAIGTALPNSGVDLYYGIGGAPEGVIAAAAMKCLGGHFEGILVDQKDYKPLDGRLLEIEDLAAGDVIFCATGVTDGHLLQGVRPKHKTHSVLMYSGTRRVYWIDAHN
jgi:fructose-1,6-bisphosphatase/sedoheptulose 1,7-bisphosphatase-like protein